MLFRSVHYATQVTRDNPWLVWVGFFWQDRLTISSTQDVVRSKAGLTLGEQKTEKGLVRGTVELSHGCAASNPGGSGLFGDCRRCTDLVKCEGKCVWDARCVAFAFAPGGMCRLYDACQPVPLAKPVEVTRLSSDSPPLPRR